MKRDVAVNIAVGCVLAAEELKAESKKEIIDLIRLLDPVPVVWEGDDEFPPKLQMMWDRNAISFLHFETTFYLQGDLIERLTKLL